MSAKTIAIADSIDFCRDALEGFFLNNHSNYQLLPICSTAPELLQTAKQQQPNIIIADVHLPGMCCMELCPRLVECCPGSPIIFRATEDMPYHARRMLKVGALGILSKVAGRAEINQCLNMVLEGRIYVPADCRHLQIQKFRQDKELSEIDQKVLLLVCKCKKQEEIGAELFVSQHQVRRSKDRINKLVGSCDRGDIMRWAWQQGYMSIKECWGM